MIKLDIFFYFSISFLIGLVFTFFGWFCNEKQSEIENNEEDENAGIVLVFFFVFLIFLLTMILSSI